MAASRLPLAKVTRIRYELGSVETVKDGTQEPWHLAVIRPDMGADQAIQLYGRRFTIEEPFRDTKGPRYGWGLSATHVRDGERRDRLLLIAAIAHEFVTLLGQAREDTGLDRTAKVNTAKKRTHSLLTPARKGRSHRRTSIVSSSARPAWAAPWERKYPGVLCGPRNPGRTARCPAARTVLKEAGSEPAGRQTETKLEASRAGRGILPRA